jgi:hypothetical protein
MKMACERSSTENEKVQWAIMHFHISKGAGAKGVQQELAGESQGLCSHLIPPLSQPAIARSGEK